jgi:large subunit ribosomal protein L23
MARVANLMKGQHMTTKDPYKVIQKRRVTEKSMVLENLKNAKSNPSVERCKTPKYVFVVDKEATKADIARAIEEIYKPQGVKVLAVNTIRVKAKKRRVRGRPGMTPSIKKAVVTLQEGDNLDNVG